MVTYTIFKTLTRKQTISEYKKEKEYWNFSFTNNKL
jgi:hypothetical protein